VFSSMVKSAFYYFFGRGKAPVSLKSEVVTGFQRVLVGSGRSMAWNSLSSI
jgi:hypothetical protein